MEGDYNVEPTDATWRPVNVLFRPTEMHEPFMNEPGNPPAANHRTFQLYWHGVAHHKTTDLVVFCDPSADEHPVVVLTREAFLDSDDVPKDLRTQLGWPACEVVSDPAQSDGAFWLLVLLSPRKMAYRAVGARLIAAG